MSYVFLFFSFLSGSCSVWVSSWVTNWERFSSQFSDPLLKLTMKSHQPHSKPYICKLKTKIEHHLDLEGSLWITELSSLAWNDLLPFSCPNSFWSMVVLSIMLSYVILFYCQNQCQTAKQIICWIKSIQTSFAGLWNVILHFSWHLSKQTPSKFGSPPVVVRPVFWSTRLSVTVPCCQRCCYSLPLSPGSPVVGKHNGGRSCSDPPTATPTSLLGRDACLLSNCNGALWAVVP